MPCFRGKLGCEAANKQYCLMRERLVMATTAIALFG